MSYGHTALALSRTYGMTPGEVQDYLNRLEAAGQTPEQAVESFKALLPEELEAIISAAAKK